MHLKSVENAYVYASEKRRNAFPCMHPKSLSVQGCLSPIYRCMQQDCTSGVGADKDVLAKMCMIMSTYVTQTHINIRQTDRQTDRQTGRQMSDRQTDIQMSDRQTDVRQTDRQTDRKTHAHTHTHKRTLAFVARICFVFLRCSICCSHLLRFPSIQHLLLIFASMQHLLLAFASVC